MNNSAGHNLKIIMQIKHLIDAVENLDAALIATLDPKERGLINALAIRTRSVLAGRGVFVGLPQHDATCDRCHQPYSISHAGYNGLCPQCVGKEKPDLLALLTVIEDEDGRHFHMDAQCRAALRTAIAALKKTSGGTIPPV